MDAVGLQLRLPIALTSEDCEQKERRSFLASVFS